jgi:hypothetical protein
MSYDETYANNAAWADVKCTERCEFCDHRSTQVQDYVHHWQSCTLRKGNDSFRRTAVIKKQELCQRAAKELDEMFKVVADVAIEG